MVGYNVQSAVDAKHHLIVTHEVTNDGVDRDQLGSMAKQVREIMGVEKLSVVAISKAKNLRRMAKFLPQVPPLTG